MADAKKRCMCGYLKTCEDCHILELSEEEQELYRKAGLTPETEILVCPPCWKLLKNQKHGPQLVRGAAQQVMSSLGVPRADQKADNHLKRIRELMEKNRG